jgi:hypothetical protein
VIKYLRVTNAVISRSRCEILREYILTAKDKEIIRVWFEEGKKVTGFYPLLDRARKHVPRLNEDLQQLETFVRSFEK